MKLALPSGLAVVLNISLVKTGLLVPLKWEVSSGLAPACVFVGSCSTGHAVLALQANCDAGCHSQLATTWLTPDREQRRPG